MSLYLSPGQSLIELSFHNGAELGSNIGHVAIGNGAFYRSVNVDRDMKLKDRSSDLMKVCLLVCVCVGGRM